MADESDEPIEASAEPLRWPDPSRPIINQQGGGAPGWGQPTGQWPQQGPPGYGPPAGASVSGWWPLIAAAVLILALIVALVLTAVWLLG